MTCLYCKGELENRKTTYLADLDGLIVVVKGVPSHVCNQCGEVSYTDEVAEQLEQIINKMRSSVSEIAVTEYRDQVA